MKYCFLFFTFFVSFSCSSQLPKFDIRPEFKSYFDECGVLGSMLIYDNNAKKWISTDAESIPKQTLPASTFKVIHLLIALETKAISSENEVIKWPGKTDTVKYGFRPEIYHDMTVKQAFKESAGWVFVEIAKKINKSVYKEYLLKCRYGNLSLPKNEIDFWNFGTLGVSPYEQVQFLINLYEEKLPFTKQNMQIVKSVLKNNETGSEIFSAKTGWTRHNHINTGWWIGYVETKGNVIFYATRLLQPRIQNRADFGECRKSISMAILRDLGYLAKPESGISASVGAIDHVPIVVKDLNPIKSTMTTLGFTIKEGRVHEGIKNCFIKFSDSSYLEFIEPLDSLHTIGAFYHNFLKKCKGGTSLAISTEKTSVIKMYLTTQKIPFAYDSNRVYQSIEPEKTDMFFIEYSNKTWKESMTNTTHANGAMGLDAVYYLPKNKTSEVPFYEVFQFKNQKSANFFNGPVQSYKIGRNVLLVLDKSGVSKVTPLLKLGEIEGICGFKIKVKSLEMFNQLVGNKVDVIRQKDRTFIVFEEEQFFMELVE